MLSPRGSMRWDTDGQGLLPLQPAPEPPPDPWLQKQGGAGASTGPRGAASQDLAEPRAASFNLATVDEHRRRKRKHCQVIRGKPKCHPSLYPMTLPRLTITRPLAYARILSLENLERERILVLSTKQMFSSFFGETHKNKDRKTIH